MLTPHAREIPALGGVPALDVMTAEALFEIDPIDPRTASEEPELDHPYAAGMKLTLVRRHEAVEDQRGWQEVLELAARERVDGAARHAAFDALGP